MVFFQETKQRAISQEFVKSLWCDSQFEFQDVEAVGSVGGLLCIWNPKAFTLTEACGSGNFILLKVELLLHSLCGIVAAFSVIGSYTWISFILRCITDGVYILAFLVELLLHSLCCIVAAFSVFEGCTWI